MSFIKRVVCSLPLMTVIVVCMLGFIETLEPMPRFQQFAWRGIYSVAGVASLSAIIWMWLRPKPAAQPPVDSARGTA